MSHGQLLRKEYQKLKALLSIFSNVNFVQSFKSLHILMFINQGKKAFYRLIYGSFMALRITCYISDCIRIVLAQYTCIFVPIL